MAVMDPIPPAMATGRSGASPAIFRKSIERNNNYNSKYARLCQSTNGRCRERPLKSRCRGWLLYDDHRGEVADACVKVGDVRVVHADAAMGHVAAHRTRLVGAVNSVLAAVQRQRRHPHGILR